MNEKTAHVQTYSGHLVDLLHPNPDRIELRDIARSLSMICRFNGHLNRFYSVAEHSLIVSQAVTGTRAKMLGLLHDAHEAYTGDISTPMRSAIGGTWILDISAKIQRAIYQSLGVVGIDDNPQDRGMVATADLGLLRVEADYMLPGGATGGWTRHLPRCKAEFDPTAKNSPEDIADLFVKEFHRLKGGLDGI